MALIYNVDWRLCDDGPIACAGRDCTSPACVEWDIHGWIALCLVCLFDLSDRWNTGQSVTYRVDRSVVYKISTP